MLDALFGGWQLSVMVSRQSGHYFSITAPNARTLLGATAIGDWWPDRIADPRLDNRSIDKWFNTAAFVLPRAADGSYHFGNAGRSIVEGGHPFNLDAGMMKSFRLTERFRAQSRWETFNVTNTTLRRLPARMPLLAIRTSANPERPSARRANCNSRWISFYRRLLVHCLTSMMQNRRLVSLGLAWAAFTMPAVAATAADFFQAIRNGESAKIRALSKDKANLALTGDKGVTPLHYAAVFGNFEGFKILVDAGANVSAKESTDVTPLHWAACDPARVKLLVEHGADVNAKTRQGRTPLMVASSCAAAEAAVKLLIEKGADVNAVQPSSGVTAMHEAAISGGPRIVTVLLAAGAKPDVADQAGLTPLQAAVGFGDLGLVARLLDKGAAANSKNTFHAKVQNGEIALKNLTPLMNAAPFGSPELIVRLLDAGGDVNMRDVRGMTPLMMAVACDNQDIRVAKLLIGRGSDVNAKAANGETVLDWARKFNEPAMIALLEKAGAKGSAMEAAPVRKAAPMGDPKAAASLSMKLLQVNSQTFFKASGCVGCHHQPMMMMAVKAAIDGAVNVDEKNLAEQLKATTTLLAPQPSRLLLMPNFGGGLDSLTFGILGMHDAGMKADMLSDSTVAYLAARQFGDGSWQESRTTSRAPMQESWISKSVMSMRALQVYPIPARKAEFEQRVAKARAWLEEAKPRHTYEQADLLLGLYWSGASGEKVKRAVTALLREQRADGGWAQRKTLASDAYATGMVLRALRESGQLRAADAAYRRAVDYLLQTQMEDGSWYVRSRAMKLQPYFQSGFPYDHDQWISFSATAYAAAALAGADGKERTAREH